MVPALMSTNRPHPHLYAGIDDWGIALDEIDGAGVNDWVWPFEFDGTHVPQPLITKYPFVIECAEFQIRGDVTSFSVPYEPRVFVVREP